MCKIAFKKGDQKIKCNQCEESVHRRCCTCKSLQFLLLSSLLIFERFKMYETVKKISHVVISSLLKTS